MDSIIKVNINGTKYPIIKEVIKSITDWQIANEDEQE